MGEAVLRSGTLEGVISQVTKTMRKSTIKAKLARNEPAMCVQLHFTDESVFELTSLLGLDGVWMDLEHMVFTRGDLVRVQHDVPLFGLYACGEYFTPQWKTPDVTTEYHQLSSCVMVLGE